MLAVLSPWLFRGSGILASFITGGAVFPKPLPPEEEQKLLLQKAEGDEDARNTLIERNLRLVAHIVKKFDNTGVDNEDLISIGVIGLIKAINTFDLARNTRLATYAARCIENEISMSERQCDFYFLIWSNFLGFSVDNYRAAFPSLLV
ncbi:MAG: sigma-70 family RNA polymerase sigma factor [Firmicutes bacterium]|nr:sigma-70 family RNA polymerase sigma factor [Bacillota bacterium]